MRWVGPPCSHAAIEGNATARLGSILFSPVELAQLSSESRWYFLETSAYERASAGTEPGPELKVSVLFTVRCGSGKAACIVATWQRDLTCRSNLHPCIAHR